MLGDVSERSEMFHVLDSIYGPVDLFYYTVLIPGYYCVARESQSDRKKGKKNKNTKTRASRDGME